DRLVGANFNWPKSAGCSDVLQDVGSGVEALARNMDHSCSCNGAIPGATPLTGDKGDVHYRAVWIDHNQGGLKIGVGGRLEEQRAATRADAVFNTGIKGSVVDLSCECLNRLV